MGAATGSAGKPDTNSLIPSARWSCAGWGGCPARCAWACTANRRKSSCIASPALPDRLLYLTAADLCERYHCSRMWITRHIQQHHFPKPVKFRRSAFAVDGARLTWKIWENQAKTDPLGGELTCGPPGRARCGARTVRAERRESVMTRVSDQIKPPTAKQLQAREDDAELLAMFQQAVASVKPLLPQSAAERLLRRTFSNSGEADMVSTNPQAIAYGGKLDEREVIGRELVIARCNPATVFDLVVEPLDKIPSSIEIRAEADRLAAIASWRNVGQCPSWRRVL